MFDFTTKTSETLQWKVNDFSKWFKDPKGLPVAPNEKVPLTHYKLSSNEPAKEDKDVFGNNIINIQKDIKADYMNKELTEKYTYGLDHKGQGDLAYEQLDIEAGDDNELSRARDEFLEQMYLKEEQPQMMSALEDAKKVIKESKTKLISDNDEIERAKAKEDLINTEITSFIGPNVRFDSNGTYIKDIPNFTEFYNSQANPANNNNYNLTTDAKLDLLTNYIKELEISHINLNAYLFGAGALPNKHIGTANPDGPATIATVYPYNPTLRP
jgi:hypothetical protein